MKTNTQGGYGIPLAIVVAGMFIAGAVIFAGGGGGTIVSDSNSSGHADALPTGEFRMPSEDDHIRGALDAPVKIVEFSDFECPFCARIHPTLTRIVEENDDVAWVYRHFPLSSIHPRALSSAVASECIAKLGGNDAFWSFAAEAFSGQRQLGDAWYREQATSFGIEASAFANCMNDRSIVTDIQADLSEATGTGGRGTPFVVVITANNQLIPFSGALPYGQIMSVIERARNN
ncbi:MAG: DsbA family protein [Candidatus Paceibacterota bacterium]